MEKPDTFFTKEFRDALLEASLDGIVTIDEKGLIVEWSRVAWDIFGYTKDEALGKVMGNLIIPLEQRKFHEAGLKRYLETGEARLLNRRIEIEAIRSDQKMIMIELAISPLIYHGQTYFTAAVRDITERKLAAQRTKMLLDELNHRVKNTLSIVQSIAKQSLRTAPSLDDFGKSFEARLIALSNTHNILTHHDWISADLREIFEQEFKPYLQEQITLIGEPVSISAKAALTIGMSAHEMTTNAAKYGSLSVHTGKLLVKWYKTNRDLIIDWIETDGPEISTPTHIGFGSKLIKIGLELQLHGHYTLYFPTTGLIGQVKIPLTSLEEEKSTQ